MKFNETIVNKLLKTMEYSVNTSKAIKDDFPSFFRTINVFNVVLDKGGYRKLVKANDGFTYDLADYQIFNELEDIILPAKISVLSNEVLSIDVRSSKYYKDDELTNASIMTPAEFRSFQYGMFARFRITPDNMKSVGEIKQRTLTVQDISERIAVYQGFNTVLGIIVEALDIVHSDIVTEAPVRSKFPIVVSSWYKSETAYTYSANDAVVDFFDNIWHKAL